MAALPLSDEDCHAAVEAVRRYGNAQRAADALRIPRGTLQHRYTTGLRRFGLSDSRHQAPAAISQTDSANVSGDRSEVTRVVPERVKSLADLVRVCEIDLTEWEVERYVCNKWEMAGMEKPTKGIRLPVVKELFQVKAWLRRKVALIAARDEIKALVELSKRQFPARPTIVRPKTKASHMLELSILDLHLGKLAWGPETGHGNYDTKIARELFLTALDTLIDRTRAFEFAEIVLPIGNDFFHSDSKAGTTTRGTPLDTDSRYHKSFIQGRMLVIEGIERCRQIASVRVVIVPGNHDTLAAFHLGDSLECFYHATKDVTVMNEPTPRKYVQFGSTMILFTHGDKGQLKNLPLLMATEQPEMFGATTHREAHTGHLHQTRVQEHMGVKVRIIPSLSAADAWHAENQFVGNARAAEAFVWERKEGLVAQATYTVQPRDGKAA